MISISILGSTGSIGTQTLDVVRDNLDKVKVCAISGNSNIELLKKQILEFNPEVCSVMNGINAIKLRNILPKFCKTEIVTGMDGLISVATHSQAHIIVTGISGMIGLRPTIEAIKLGKTIALANKETLVTGGEYIMHLAKKYKATILPVDSEHSAIFQALQGNKHESINKLILTASGGPFLGKSEKELENVTLDDALNHPTWKMGRKITIDSATLMNKGLEVIEAKYLFNIPEEKIEVVVHPQSIIHSAVEYCDHSTLAQMGLQNMRIPIQYALFYPKRIKNNYETLSLSKIKNLTFEEPDKKTFRCLDLAYYALKIGGTLPTILNASNELVVNLFLEGKVKFLDIPKIIEVLMTKHSVKKVESINDILDAELWSKIQIENKQGVLSGLIN
ncbi:1-deoxy-D-xylulose-5-phosphate reductoisomerase [Sedimentibacter sp. zth1]|uniref:1-deoxy-D-xylulose-5-phosphate reductoisomerase n=1 Tax=Sedimentibacter sp. zth1 TaxID=2816908 RepID=UPI001A91F7D5|nr:1-deoxy-D-xylulose-5-phosphate reductoisomerase [Sedimentibacter sp. zth1]QSX06055.1 1-deoxy-D-xylulose-5-phosphate reductoisomerase [Sedimentibacter sp. zth1]